MNDDVLIIGCGYTGRRLGARLAAGSVNVRGLVAHAASAADLVPLGIAPQVEDLDSGENGIPADGALVYYGAPPPRDGDTDSRLARTLTRLSGVPHRIVYLSTTGVYGDRDGERVDETTAPAPQNARSRRRLDAETRLRNYARANGCEWVILRVAGIYGPGRLPMERLRAGDPVLRDADSGFSNRIYIDDLVTVCERAGISASAANEIFNVADGAPTTTAAFSRELARQAGLAPPLEVDWERMQATASAMRRSFLAESKQVAAGKLQEVLGVTLEYPDYRAGIRAALSA